jgi:hypothetical protein
MTGSGVQAQGHALAEQMFYHLSHTHSPFCFYYFSSEVLRLCQAIQDHDPSIYASHIAVTTGVSRHAQLLFVEMKSHEPFAWAGLET